MKMNGPNPPEANQETPKSKCGIVMPISTIDGCPETHWQDVREILSEAIESAGFEPNLVSDADEVGIIQKRIIQNLYENPVVVCDVSGKNPNVMFELGLRLAFDKPTIIVKDDKTTYSFDTSPIEHLEYPRDLRFSKIVEFKDDLAEKIQATVEKASNDKNYTTFLKHFGTFTVPKLETVEVSKDKYIFDELESIKKSLAEISSRASRQVEPETRRRVLCLQETTSEVEEQILAELKKIENIAVRRDGTPRNGHSHFSFLATSPNTTKEVLLAARSIHPSARILGSMRPPQAQ